MIGKAIYSILSNDAGVTNLLSTRIYPTLAPQGTAHPYATYRITNTEMVGTKETDIPREMPQVQIDVFARSRADAENAGAAIRSALHGYTGTVEGIKITECRIINHDDEQLDAEYLLYIVTQDYEFRINKL